MWEIGTSRDIARQRGPRATRMRARRALGAWVLVLSSLAGPVTAQTDDGGASPGAPPRFVAGEGAPASPQGLVVIDAPGDAGTALDLSWTLPASVSVDSVIVYRMSGSGDASPIATLPGPATSFTDRSLEKHAAARYTVELFSGGTSARSTVSASMVPVGNWFDGGRLNQLIILALLIGSIGYFTAHASRGREFYIRKIAGIDAVDEAVGRATEMGRSVLFVPGINDLDDVQTLAALNILAKIAHKVAQYESKLDVPVSRSLVMSTGRETIREAYLLAGRPDLYNDDICRYITDEQFGYVAAVDGIMVRQKPAACFYLGAFFAESLILAETGNSIGAIQVAGTAQPTQLPFFVAACDYTLIGEELFAASAYLSKDLKMIGSLRGQDIGKGLAMASVLVGVIALTAGLDAVGAGIKWLFTVN